MNTGGLDIATTTGLTAYVNGVYTATTFTAKKKKFLDLDDKKDKAGLDARTEGDIAAQFAAFLRVWLITNGIQELAIEAPIASNTTRTKTIVDTSSNWAGQSVRKEQVAGTSMSAIFRAYGLEMVACMVAAALNIPVRFVAQGTWRKEFLGNGRPKDAKKEAKAHCEKLGIKITSLDAAESVGVCWWLNSVLQPPKDLLAALPRPATFVQMSAREAAEQLFRK